MNARNAFVPTQLHSQRRLFMIKSNIYDETTCIDYSLMRLSCARSIMLTAYPFEDQNPTIIAENIAIQPIDDAESNVPAHKTALY